MAFSAKRQNPAMKIQLPVDRLKLPRWMKIRAQNPNKKYLKMRKLSRGLQLATVCAEAACPNIGECWRNGTATFMLMGDTCTRACRFCNVNHGKPPPLNPKEPEHLAKAIQRMNIQYAVITCVDRDDLLDNGAAHLAKCISHLRKKCPKVLVEILVGDFQGAMPNVQTVLDTAPHVFAHNIETVERLQREVRDHRANYRQSLAVLKYAKENSSYALRTKSSIMVGLGEKPSEVIQAMCDLRESGVDFLTIGQYLRPAAWNLPVKEYIEPAQFEWYRKEGLKLGFEYVAAGPYVRSSYKAYEFYQRVQSAGK